MLNLHNLASKRANHPEQSTTTTTTTTKTSSLLQNKLI